MTDSFEQPAPNWLARPVIVVALIIIGAWNLAGWWLSDGPFAVRLVMAALTLTFEILCANVSAQKARSEQRAVSANVRRFWLLALIMCSGWSVFCAHSALRLFTPDMSDLARAPAFAVLGLAAFVIPLMPWAIERTEQAAPLSASIEGEEPPASAARHDGQPPVRTGAPLHQVGKAAVAATVVGASSATAAPLKDQRAPAAHVRPTDDEAWRAQAWELWIGGERNKSEIARAVGRPRETVRRALRAMGV